MLQVILKSSAEFHLVFEAENLPLVIQSIPQLFLFSQLVQAPHRVLLSTSSMQTPQVKPPGFYS